MAIPREPVLFSKYPTALIGHGEPIVAPPVSTKVDYEAELVIVVGKGGRHIPEAQALDHVAGYTVGHDVSARDWQLEKDGKQWMVGKTFDTFAPVGPNLVTADEVPDPHKLGIRLRLNGKTMQDSNTEQMIFSVAQLVAYLSLVFTLEPGDLIFTGTPPGVGLARSRRSTSSRATWSRSRSTPWGRCATPSSASSCCQAPSRQLRPSALSVPQVVLAMNSAPAEAAICRMSSRSIPWQSCEPDRCVRASDLRSPEPLQFHSRQ